MVNNIFQRFSDEMPDMDGPIGIIVFEDAVYNATAVGSMLLKYDDNCNHIVQVDDGPIRPKASGFIFSHPPTEAEQEAFDKALEEWYEQMEALVYNDFRTLEKGWSVVASNNELNEIEIPLYDLELVEDEDSETYAPYADDTWFSINEMGLFLQMLFGSHYQALLVGILSNVLGEEEDEDEEEEESDEDDESDEDEDEGEEDE